MGIVFLMTDAQVAEEKFLVVINDCLASGEISELFPDDEVDNLINTIRTEVNNEKFSQIIIFFFALEIFSQHDKISTIYFR